MIAACFRRAAVLLFFLVAGPGPFRNHRLSFDKSRKQVLRTWHRIFWRREQLQDLVGFDSVRFGTDRRVDINSSDDPRFSVSLTGPDEVNLTLFGNQGCNDAKRLSQEIAKWLALQPKDADPWFGEV